MKATGIVRRIDDLGRVVIPKEIRRTLRIRESDPIEIFTGRDGEIILQKYSPVNELSDVAKIYCESLSKACGQIACITDRDQIIAISGGKKDYLMRHIHPELENVIEKRETFTARMSDINYCRIVDGDDTPVETISPIICSGDIIGCVCILGKSPDTNLGITDEKLTSYTAAFLASQMEA